MNRSLARCVMLLSKDFTRYCNRQLSEMGLSQGLLYFILYVGKHPHCSPKELTEAMHLDAGHATRSLAKLEQGGFLLSSQNPADRRGHLLILTEKGQEAFLKSHQLFPQWDQSVLCDINPEEQTMLIDLLTAAIAHTKEESHASDSHQSL